MYLTEEILGKLNGKTAPGNAQQITLPDIMIRSFAELKELTGDALTWGEKNFLWQQAQKALKENKMAESRILSRANPQLANAVRLGIRQSPALGGYDDLFPQRANSFVKPGAVASMFSPAGYLTELYREARNLHPETSQYHLDTRRPDLASLALSQPNMDDELSTLTLSSELLLNNIQAQEDKSYDEVVEMLATYRLTGATPFHQPYEASRQAILLQDPAFEAFRNNPSVAAKMDTSGLLGIGADLSPELHDILTEEITEANADELIKKNFGDISLAAFQNVTYLAHWYGLTNEEMSSLLGVVSASVDPVLGVQYYQNDQLISLVESDGTLSTVLMKRNVLNNNNNLNYAELLPTSNNYIFSFAVGDKDEGHPKFEIKDGDNKTYEYLDEDFIPEANKPYHLPPDALTPEKLTADGGLTLYVNRWNDKTSGRSSTFNFQQKTYPFNVFLLKLNKLIRLYKATGIAPSDVRTVIESVNNDLTITGDVLSRLFWANYYAQRSGVDYSAALVLAGADISQIAHSNKDSAFNRLFNTPLLNNQRFSADGTVLNLKPGKSEDTFRLGALKRALRVDDTGLYTLYTLTFTDKDSAGKAVDFTTTIGNLSALYRTRLLAEVNQLTVTELSLLLSVSPYAGRKLDTLTGEALNGLADALERHTQWLKEMNWTVSDLYLMLTDSYSTVLSPDIQNLIDTLKNGLSSQDPADTDAALITAAAPFIAAATQLDSAETASAILQWLDQLKPQGLAVTDFLGLVDNDSRTDEQNLQLVSFCQVMGQLALIVRNTGLSASELSWGVAHPVIFVAKATVLAQNLDTLRDLTQLHALLARSGTYASEILTSLSGKGSSEKGNLAVDTVATALSLDEQALKQALAQVSSDKYFYNWVGLRDALQWLDVATTFGITPDDVAKMVALKYNGTNASPYADWVAVSHALQAGLNTQQTAQLNASLDEALSAALSAYAIKNITPSFVSDRDKLYSWLLIDNQVSAQVKTTRIAEAIASVQLYVNRALTGQEEGVDNAVKSGRFFTADWDTCNKRYSTWAGISELVYYPENYVDPTLRIGQTGMMDEMLQTLSQSQLTPDTVEAAFKTYMTRFEEIANLNIVSGYHDSVSDQSGITYLIGRSAAGDYYWRSADIDKMSDGKLPANAWTEWKKITTAVTPVNNLVRPVIFQSRLYLFWVERRDVATYDDKKNKTTQSTEYQLKYCHILHDGTWSSPLSILIQLRVDISDKVGMYCAEKSQDINIIFYLKQDKYDSVPEDIILAGFSTLEQGAISSIDATQTKRILSDVYKQLDTTNSIGINTIYTSSDISFLGVVSSTQSIPVGALSAPRAELTGGLIDNGLTKFTFNLKVSESYQITEDASRNKRILELAEKVFKKDNIQEIYVPVTKNKTSDFFIKSDDEVIYVRYYEDFLTDKDRYKFYYNNTHAMGGAATYSFGNDDSLGADIPWVEDESHSFMYSLLTYYYSPGHSDMLAIAHLVAYNWIFTDFRTLPTVGGYTASTDNNAKIAELPEPTRSGSNINAILNYDDCSLIVPDDFKNNLLNVTLSVKNTAGASQDIILSFSKSESQPIIRLNSNSNSECYITYGIHRVRLNTLFARQLVARANAGLDSVLSYATQQLEEPKLGKGAYVQLELNTYDASVNGTSPAFDILMCDVFAEGDSFTVVSGTLSTVSNTYCTFFLPRLDESTGSPTNMYFRVKFQLENEDVIKLTVSGGEGNWTVSKGKDKDGKETFGIGIVSASIVNKTTEPMDFSGANALYFWEMFYYVPMMVFKRLLSESRFTEATQWIKYIWNPDGYLVNHQPATYTWNVRPLEEETTWHADPLDSVDPDAVAQADPMHYKVATFMSWLDLLIARGDVAYRQLERDTLNEAKMWYVQALNILGDEPYQSANTGWPSPRLIDAADKTTQKNLQQALMAVRQPITAGGLRTANSLTGLFLPQQNAKLQGYWQTLSQRLYNLRHNLSIDGSPLSLAIYATPANPAALLSAAVSSAAGGGDLPAAVMPLYRFPVILESARGMVSQLTQFGSTLLSITERQDAEALSELLQTQGSQLILQSIALQNSAVAEIDADKTALETSLSGAQSRLDSYTTLYDEDVNTGETQAMDLYLSASVISTTATALHMAGAALDVVPNIYGMAVGGGRYGALLNATAIGAQIGGDASRIAADRISQSESYRRRRQEWEIQRNAAQADVKQIEAQLASLAVRRESAVLQKTYLETQQGQMQAQMTLLQNRFTSKALYNWLHGKLAAIYYQFYDLTVSRCLMAQAAYSWTTGVNGSFIRPGVWQGTYGGLMAGETLMLNLAQMEQAYLQKDEREKEVTRTVCLSEFYAALSSNNFTLDEQITVLVNKGSGSAGTNDNGLKIESRQLQATLKLSDLKIADDYPDALGKTRCIKQISVTLPALVGPYQDVRAALSYGGSVTVPRGCNAIAVSHGMSDSGQFQLDFSDSRWLPFEGIPVNDGGTLTLSFPDVDSKQKDLLLSLTDIILHIRYTIVS